jgi:hypothetical protein
MIKKKKKKLLLLKLYSNFIKTIKLYPIMERYFQNASNPKGKCKESGNIEPSTARKKNLQ